MSAAAVHAHAAEDWVRPFHGGIAQSAGDYHLELAIGDGQAALYLYDRQNTPLPNDEFTGSALVWLVNGVSLDLPWRADDRKRLILDGDFKAENVKRLVVTLKPPFGKPLHVWFVIPAKPAPTTQESDERGGAPK